MTLPRRALAFATVPFSSRVTDFVYCIQVIRLLLYLHANNHELPCSFTSTISVRVRVPISFLFPTLLSMTTNIHAHFNVCLN